MSPLKESDGFHMLMLTAIREAAGLSEGWASGAKTCLLLERIGELEHGEIGSMPTNDLNADWESGGSEPCWNGDRRSKGRCDPVG